MLLLFVLFLFVPSITSHSCETVNPFNPAHYQLETFRQCTRKPVGLITTSTGQPVEIRDTNTLNTNLLHNNFFLDSLAHSMSERIPERMVHAKGAGAFGYFEVLNDISYLSSASMFSKVGKRTPLALRFSHTTPSLGGSDLVKDSRGASVKFYTDEGNLDLVCLNTPIFTFRDPVLFPQLFHANKVNPATNLLDATSRWDFATLRPESLFFNFWVFSDYGLPNGYRHMPFFAIHTFELYNQKGETSYVRFNFTTDQGIENLSSDVAAALGAQEPNYFIRDLYNSIENKNYPSWTLYMDIISKDDLKHIDFDPFDVTRLWPAGSYETILAGRLVLNKNIINHFAEMEQIAFCPGNLVPGIRPPPDKLFEARILAYRDTQNHRLGFNHNNILVNRPNYAKTYNRDGKPPVGENMKDVPNYYPNSFNGPIPVVETARPKNTLQILESSAVDLEPPSRFYTDILNKGQRIRLVNNLVASISMAVPSIQKRAVKLFTKVHPELGRRFSEGLRNANITIPMPSEILYG